MKMAMKTATHVKDHKVKKIKVVVPMLSAAEARARLVAAEERLAVVDRYSWYIENALRVRLDQMIKQVTDGRKTLEGPGNDGSLLYRSLENMCNHVDSTIRDFQKAYDELVKVGIK